MASLLRSMVSRMSWNKVVSLKVTSKSLTSEPIPNGTAPPAPPRGIESENFRLAKLFFSDPSPPRWKADLRIRVTEYLSRERSLMAYWLLLSKETKTAIKCFLIPVAFSGAAWAVKTPAQYAKDKLQGISAHERASDQGIDNEELKRTLSLLMEENADLKSEIEKLTKKLYERDAKKLYERDAKIKKLLAGRTTVIFALCLEGFAQNLISPSMLTYYDPPELYGLRYWNP